MVLLDDDRALLERYFFPLFTRILGSMTPCFFWGGFYLSVFFLHFLISSSDTPTPTEGMYRCFTWLLRLQAIFFSSSSSWF